MKNTEKIYLNVDDRKIFGILNAPDHENGEKMPIVIMMHGIKMSTGQYPFFDLVKLFNEKKIATFRFDFFGHGRSEGEFERLTLSKAAKDAETVINYVKELDFVSDIILLGHSMGGDIVIIEAAKHPDIVKHLILIAPAVVLYTMPERGTSFGRKIDFNNLPEKIVYSDDFVLRKEYFMELKNYNYMELAKDFPGQVCIMLGDQDERIPKSYADELNENFANSYVRMMPGGHHMLSDCGDQVLAITKEFIEKIY